MRQLPKPLLAFLIFVLFAASLEAREWGDPSGYFAQETIQRREIHPGVTWWQANGKLNGKPLRGQIVAIDLARSDLALQALIGAQFVNPESGQFFRRSTTSQLQQDNQALAAINVAFFDISATQAPEGLTLREGLVLREPSGRHNVIYLPDGRAALADLGWQAQVQVGAQKRPLTGVNRPALGGDEVNLYLPPWAISPGISAGFTKDQKVREILVEKTDFKPAAKESDRSRLTGRVLEVRDVREGVEIGENQFVLSASGRAAPFFRNLKAGDDIEVSWELTGAPQGVRWHELREVVSSGPLLLRGGVPEEGSGSFWDGLHPRSAVGISRDGRQVLLIVVDGRAEESVGISLGDLADLLAHLGAHEALNLDGGGSSALAARIGGESLLINTPSDGRERYVPTGLGVVITDAGAAESLNKTRIWTGANGRTMSGLFQSYDPASGQVSLVLDGRRFTFPLSSLSDPDQDLILDGSPEKK